MRRTLSRKRLDAPEDRIVMSQTCRDCSRVNPSEAAYCYFDGVQLNGRTDLPTDGSSISFSNWVFPNPFVFPSGEVCRNFPQLARACRKNPQGANDLLSQGFLESFLGSLGRVDLALAAREAGRHPDRERGLDDFLAKLPGTALEPAKLEVEPGDIDLGAVAVGEERRFDLVLRNDGDRLVYGKVAADDCPWLILGDSGAAEKLFQFADKTVIPVRVRGDRLRAYTKPQKGEILVESNGGNLIVTVNVMVPIKPFSEGMLAGAMTPRQFAEKAKANQGPAAALIESGAVARWYEANGWAYPVQGPSASGIAAIQQLFEALGLVKAPKVELAEPAIALGGRPGERREHVLTVTTAENRPVFAYATSDQPWLTVGKPVYRGRSAALPLVIEAVPHEPGRTLQARLKVTANGNTRFEVPLVLAVADAPPVGPAPRSGMQPTAAVSAATVPTEVTAAPATPPVSPAVRAVPTPVVAAVAVTAVPAALASPDVELVPVAAPRPTAPPTPVPVPVTPAAPGSERRERLLRLLPIAIVVVGLLIAVVRDIGWREQEEKAEVPPIDPKPRIELKFHAEPLANDFIQPPFGATMRFGVLMPDPGDPKKFKKLTYDEFGRTSNTCVRVGTYDFLLGDATGGHWELPIKQPLGKDPLEGNRERIGYRSKWIYTNPAITIEQQAEVIPGGLSPDGKGGEVRLLDTCLVSYVISNNDRLNQKIGLRFLLDTYIGANDGVPFTIPGEKDLCDTFKDFVGTENVPDFISALERQDVKDPGTVAHVSLKVGGGLEPPTRVTLGSWPDGDLFQVDQAKGAGAKGELTLWEVPVMSMQAVKQLKKPNGDSAVTLYWGEKELPPSGVRKLGFAYGLGSVTGDAGKGTLGLTSGGELVAGKEFTLTAYVKDPVQNQTVTLGVPPSLTFVGGDKDTKPVPAASSGSVSTVTWHVKASKSGVFTLNLSSGGVSLKHKIMVRPEGELYR